MVDIFDWALLIAGMPGFLCVAVGLIALPFKFISFVIKRLSKKHAAFQEVYLMLVYPFVQWRNLPEKQEDETENERRERQSWILLMFSYVFGVYLLIDRLIFPILEEISK